MENRYKLPKDIQIEFLKKVETVSGLKVDDLASLFGVVARSYRDWRKGKFTIPERIIIIIDATYNISLPGDKFDYIDRWRQSRKFAAKKGGVARIKKHGFPGTTEGRKKGGRQALLISRAKGLIQSAKPFYKPRAYSKELAEFVGILLGDGHVDKYQWSISLNATSDNNYAAYVVQLIKNLFKFSPPFRIRSGYNVIIILGSGVKSVQYLTEIGLQVGNKVKLQVDVPTWIKTIDSYRLACLRGLIDTDGGIFNNTYKVNNKMYSYNKLAFVNSSIPLLHFAFETLNSIGLKPTLIENVSNKRIWLGNQNEVKQYLQIVGTHNTRLLQHIIEPTR